MRKTIFSVCLIMMFVLMNNLNGFALDKEDLNFSDVSESEWFASYILNEVISRHEDGTFRPNTTITKTEFITFVLNALSSKQEIIIKGSSPISYIREAESLGLLDKGEFQENQLNQDINRYEVAKILIRAIDEEYPKDFMEHAVQIKDYDTVPSTYQEYVLKAHVKGLISGYPDGEFKGNRFLTRAEASVMVMKMINEDKRSILKEVPKNSDEKAKTKEDEKRKNIVNTALKFKGVPYRWGGTSPDGFDSSGFIWYVFRENGINIPRVSSDIYKFGKPIKKEELQPGDLVFFEGYKSGPSHGSIYIGDNQFIHSPSTGKTIAIDNLDEPYYWGPRQYGALQIIE